LTRLSTPRFGEGQSNLYCAAREAKDFCLWSPQGAGDAPTTWTAGTSPALTLLGCDEGECGKTRHPQATKTLGAQSSFDKLREYGHMPIL
jgi:hypothetical protein